MAPESREVRQRINSLYDQAEDATGNFNATRALSGKRSRGVPLAKRSGGRQDPALDAVARQWFEGARAMRGPSVPAALPADRQPGRAAGPGRSQERAGGARDALSVGLPELAPGSAGRPGGRAVAELPSGSSPGAGGRPRPALEAGGAGLPGGPPAEPPSGRPAELPSARTGQTLTGTGELPALDAGWGTAGQGSGDAPEPNGPAAAEYSAFGPPDGTGQGRVMAPVRPTADPLGFSSPDTTGQGRSMTPGRGTTGQLGFSSPDTTGQGRIMAPGRPTADPLGFGSPDTTGQSRSMTPGQATARPARGTAGYLNGGTADTNGRGVPLPASGPPQPAVVPPGLAVPDQVLQATAALPVQDPAQPPAQPTRGTAGHLGGGTTDTGTQEVLPAGQGSVVLPAQRQAPVDGTGMADVLGPGVPVASGRGPAETAVLPAAAPQMPPALQPRDLPTSSGAPRRTLPPVSKAENQRKLAAAGDLLFRRAAQLTTAVTSDQAAPATQSTWAAEAQQVPQPAVARDGQVGQPVPAGQAGVEQWGQPDLRQPGQGGFQQPAPTGLQAWSQLDAGRWQQPLGAVPGPTATPGMPASAGPAATLTTAPPTPDLSFPAQPLSAQPLPALADAGSFSPLPAPPFPQLAATTAPLPVPAPQTTRAARAIAFARGQVGKPCVWGATGPDSYDCSSLTQAAWKAAGVALPRAAHEQALAGTPVPLGGLEPGDLVLFFDDDRHVGLHIGGGMMVHAPGPGSSIREESIYGAGESAIHRVIRPA